MFRHPFFDSADHPEFGGSLIPSGGDFASQVAVAIRLPTHGRSDRHSPIGRTPTPVKNHTAPPRCCPCDGKVLCPSVCPRFVASVCPAPRFVRKRMPLICVPTLTLVRPRLRSRSRELALVLRAGSGCADRGQSRSPIRFRCRRPTFRTFSAPSESCAPRVKSR